MATLDILVIGGGINGMNTARQLKRQISDTTMTVIEKRKTQWSLSQWSE